MGGGGPGGYRDAVIERVDSESGTVEVRYTDDPYAAAVGGAQPRAPQLGKSGSAALQLEVSVARKYRAQLASANATIADLTAQLEKASGASDEVEQRCAIGS